AGNERGGAGSAGTGTQRRAEAPALPAPGAGMSEVVSPPHGGRRPFPFVRRRRGGGTGLSGPETVLLLIPALLPIVALSIIPLARGIYLRFTDSHAGFNVPPHFIGIDNFRN